MKRPSRLLVRQVTGHLCVLLCHNRKERMRVHDHVQAMLHSSWLEQLQNAMAK